ncbi:bifunctional 4-hydroxy-2-oxoglutarate aldolase/2-dehydro-3-deoxy-phosphogluconate aldolase [Marinilongibacter aquaticus]|uniref:bifunctional 4-hydroxy-2-oxoglutarate aldolase/2-dehydro-3-deoxy-phosphogluconate aldolase n=1 Tax=Marinilongibacter aquaticus TaxID=2975157 RepID=UPI0021BDE4B9|nr:bifunctional 4-hydroxy-2-oxoglutarate aldolase/2-dehydro-3-deoxy-phosphogluconate aldolase [Marinilongibacter aquaticus]UBM59352.1 bifunctional 4-hydroxy-2-oxoglutarate aldolase/2-dehydro-3-deoxy-phosphogluconate aldolase [Marinilongibacter aquaticus]
MSDFSFSQELFKTVPIVGILRNVDFEDFKHILDIARSSGLTSLEVTMNTAAAPEMIAYAREKAGENMNIGAGTVCDEADLKEALAAGAQFIVSPIVDEDVIKTCVAKQIPIFPGAYTPTEIYRCWKLGAETVKVFPATVLGPSYIKDVLGPLNEIGLLPTGGVRLDNMKAFAQAGAVGFGLGGSLFPSAMIKAKQWKELAQHIETYVHEIKTLYPNEI